MSNQKRYRTLTSPAKAAILDPGSDRYKSVANQIEERFGFKPPPQIDLLYVESCLVTAGCNDNDDAFLNDELWKARATPVLKPANWQHSEKDILGVVYSVQARDLDGNVIPFDQEDTPDEPFELFTEAVIFKLIHAEKANEISERHARGNLFVSMEAWFDNYDYVVMDDQGQVDKVIARNEQTAFLDKRLRANGGSGQHDDQRIGRGLRDITFGGFGFVDRPANKRSDITLVADMVRADGLGNENELNDLLRKFMSSVKESQPTEVALTQETELMTATAGNNENNSVDRNAIEQVVASALSKHETEREEKAARAALETKTGELVTANESLSKDLETANEKAQANKAEIDALQASRVDLDSKVAELINTVAGATGDTPPEIAKIDSVTDGDSAFAAKISWITDSLKALASRAERADELEEELSIAANQLREEEIKNLFAEVVDEQHLDALVTIGTSIEDGEKYDQWLAEKKFFAQKLSEAAGKEDDKKKDKKMPPFMKKKMKEGEDKSNANDAVDAAVKFLQEDLGLSSGLNAGTIRTPRHKVAGNETANDDPNSALANAKPEDNVNLAGAGRGDGEDKGDKTPAMRILAQELFPKKTRETNND